MANERERDEEIIGLLTGISVVSRQLARKLLRLHAAPRKRVYPEIWRTQKRMQRSGCCVCPPRQLWACDADCAVCPYFKKQEETLPLDAPIDGEESLVVADTIPDNTQSPEEIAADRALLDALWRELDALDPEGRRICELLSGHSERQAAELMGMNRCTFHRHWEKVKALLAERLADYR